MGAETSPDLTNLANVSGTNFDFLFKILFIGDSGVGKSCLMLRFAEKDYVFKEQHQSTIGVDFKIKTIVLDGKQIKLQIWDSAGQERFRAIAGNYYKGSHGVGICFDLTNEKTFENLPLWLTEIEQHADCKPHLVLIGTKTDLKKKRVITRAKAEEFAAAHNMLYIETSAKTSLNVVETFEMITRQLLKDHGTNLQAKSSQNIHVSEKDEDVKPGKCC